MQKGKNVGSNTFLSFPLPPTPPPTHTPLHCLHIINSTALWPLGGGCYMNLGIRPSQTDVISSIYIVHHLYGYHTGPLRSSGRPLTARRPQPHDGILSGLFRSRSGCRQSTRAAIWRFLLAGQNLRPLQKLISWFRSVCSRVDLVSTLSSRNRRTQLFHSSLPPPKPFRKPRLSQWAQKCLNWGPLS